MLARIVHEYDEVFNDGIASRLHPVDIARLSTVCRNMTVLRRHPAAIHVWALAPSLRAIRVPYIVKPYYNYRTSHRIYKISAKSHMSIRGDVTYCYNRTRNYFDMNYMTVKKCARGMLTRIDMDEFTPDEDSDDIRMVDIYMTAVDIIDMWSYRMLTFESISGFIRHPHWYLNARDMYALMGTCRSMKNTLRFYPMSSVD